MTHLPLRLHTWPVAHEPQLAPQPSYPHSRPWLTQTGSHLQCPDLHVSGKLQVPHVPPQPSEPHASPEHVGAQVPSHVPALHEPPPAHGPP